MSAWAGQRQRRALPREALGDVQPGDLVLVRRPYGSPWGYWAHSVLVSEVSRDQVLFIHAYKGRVREDVFPDCPRRFSAVVLRVEGLDARQRLAVVQSARRLLGNRFSLFTNHRDTSAGSFSCASLLSYCFLKQGIDLRPDAGRFIFPDELFASPRVKVCTFFSGDGRAAFSPAIANGPLSGFRGGPLLAAEVEG